MPDDLVSLGPLLPAEPTQPSFDDAAAILMGVRRCLERWVVVATMAVTAACDAAPETVDAGPIDAAERADVGRWSPSEVAPAEPPRMECPDGWAPLARHRPRHGRPGGRAREPPRPALEVRDTYGVLLGASVGATLELGATISRG